MFGCICLYLSVAVGHVIWGGSLNGLIVCANWSALDGTRQYYPIKLPWLVLGLELVVLIKDG